MFLILQVILRAILAWSICNMRILKIIALCIFVIFANISVSIAQFRLIKAHSDREDRLISTNLSLLDPLRNYKQSARLISPIIENENTTLDPILSTVNFSNRDFSYFAWNNPEYGGNHLASFTQKSWIQKLGGSHLWNNPNRFFSWESEDRQDYLVVNPILDLSYSPSLGSFDTTLLNGRGVELYGQMGDKLAFYSQIYDYQANYPFHIDEYEQKHKVYPGLGNVQTNSFG